MKRGDKSDRWCRHRVVFDSDHPLCEVGIDWTQFRGEFKPGWLDAMPCLGHSEAARARCQKYEARPAQELEKEERNVQLMLVAFSLCLADVGKLPRPHRGTIQCPKCEGPLDYIAKASKVGTIWGKCRTAGCLEWMV